MHAPTPPEPPRGRGAFERAVALRFLRGGGAGSGFLRFVSVVAVAGVALGTGALLLALSIVRGFSSEIEEKVVGFGQHVQVESYLGEPLGGADTLAARLAAFPGVQAVVPAVIDFALLSARGPQGRLIEGVLLWGTPPDGQPFIAGRVEEGTFSFSPDTAGHVGVVLGDALARRLDVGVGATLTAFATRGLEAGGLAGRPTLRQFHVAGLFDTGLADFDDRFAYTDLGAARAFFDYAEDEVGRFDLVLDDLDRSPALAEAITEEIGPPVFARSIFDVFRHLFAWVRLQQSIIPLVISALVLVAAFNIIGTLLMMILDKTREIGILLGMGASSRTVRRLFLWLGFFIGVAGSSAGAASALAFAFLQLRFGLVRLPQEAYYIDTAPVELHALDFVLVPLLAVVLCTLAAYLPARAAARIEPIRSIRFGA
jgi:lipoprotein-releasing system permease protein